MTPAVAQAKVTNAPNPCVNRDDGAPRSVRDPKLDDKTLAFCTGDDCWSFDLATKVFKPIAKLPAATRDKDGELSIGGKLVATATPTDVSFCPAGPKSCKQFKYKLEVEADGSVFPVMNAEGTLGAIVYHGLSEAGAPSFVLTFDLDKNQQLKQVKAHDAQVLHSVFVIDDAFYSVKHKKLGKLAVADHGWERIANSDLVALHDDKKGDIVIQDGRTGKLKSRIPLGVSAKDTWFTFVSSVDGARLYAIGSQSDEGELLTIDVAAGKIIARETPTVCAPGTRRVN